jgi:plastocyanin
MNRWKIVASLVVGSLVVGVVAVPVRAEDNAVIKGKVIFKGDPEKYKRATLDTTKDSNCAKKIGSEEVVLNKKTDPITIKNVVVSIKEGLGDRKFPPKTEEAILDQNGCQYSPHVLAVMEGQSVMIRNSDPTNHNIHFLPKINEEFNKTQPKQGMQDKITLKTEAPFKVKCDVHPWMGMHVAVFNHPFFAVTGDEGTFEIKNLPPGKYVVEAWHEKFGSITVPVEVTSGATKDADLTFEPDKK